jgi:DNA-binding NtrC family response regulator
MPDFSILVVEKEEGFLRFIARALEVNGYGVFCARTGKEALEILEKERFDVALVDVFLPGLNGIELLKRIKERSDRIEVLMMASGAPTNTVVRAMKAGAYEYIEKPIDLDHLMIVLKKALEKVQLAQENLAYKRLSRMHGEEIHIVCESPEMKEILKTVELVAKTDLTVLIEGESGVGKELIARLIHQKSMRANMPFIAINCAALQETLLESELFGHDKGAFTGAISEHQGLFEVADKGTIFLDEIAEMSPDLQVKLLRVLETNEFRRVGGHRLRRIDVRVLAATNKNLTEEMKKGRFREDLFYRLNVIHLEIPPLRRRKDEIPRLIENFFERSRLRGFGRKRISPEAMELLLAYSWRGNVRELENLLERLQILCRHDEINVADLPHYVAYPSSREIDRGSDDDLTLAELERRHIIRSLKRHRGNKVRTARALGINVKTLYNKIRAYEITQYMPSR